jgi:hypothetical protein
MAPALAKLFRVATWRRSLLWATAHPRWRPPVVGHRQVDDVGRDAAMGAARTPTLLRTMWSAES